MSIAITGSRSMFGRLQKALSNLSNEQQSRHITAKKGVHQALDDFLWLARDLETRPTRIAELIPLSPVADGHHDASGAGAGGVRYPMITSVLGKEQTQTNQSFGDLNGLISSDNSHGSITNSDLELAGGLLHLACIASTFDVRERTVLSWGENLDTTF
ncbi:hypothetical protein ACHAXR_004575 [Thalassiosira sp. AJA248-18]